MCTRMLDSQGEHEFLWEGSRSLPLLMFLQYLLWRAVLSAGSHLTNQATNKVGVRMDFHGHRNISTTCLGDPWTWRLQIQTIGQQRAQQHIVLFIGTRTECGWKVTCLKSTLHPPTPVSFVSAASKQRDLGGVPLLSGS